MEAFFPPAAKSALLPQHTWKASVLPPCCLKGWREWAGDKLATAEYAQLWGWNEDLSSEPSAVHKRKTIGFLIKHTPQLWRTHNSFKNCVSRSTIQVTAMRARLPHIHQCCVTFGRSRIRRIFLNEWDGLPAQNPALTRNPSLSTILSPLIVP